MKSKDGTNAHGNAKQLQVMTDVEPTRQPVDSDDPCDKCTHLFGGHRLCGYEDAIVGMPVGGWVECGVGGCTCLSTWGLDGSIVNQLRARRTDDPRIIDHNTCPDCCNNQCRVAQVTDERVTWVCVKCAHEYVT